VKDGLTSIYIMGWALFKPVYYFRPMRFVFFGSADFGLPALQRLLDSGHEAAGVVTTPDRAQGRGLRLRPSPVAMRCEELRLLPVLKPEQLDSDDLVSALRELAADLFVVIAYRILPERVFSIPRLGTVNVHASLLPRYRGPAPIQRAIENGEARTGVTVFRIDKGTDTGGVLVQLATEIGPEETSPELYERLSVLGADALEKAVAGMRNGTLEPAPQDNSAATRAPRLRKEEAWVDWALPAEVIVRRVRAFQPFPGTCTKLAGKRIAIVRARTEGAGHDREPGTVYLVDHDGFVVAAGEGSVRVCRVKPEGKGEMDAGAFIRGMRNAEGAVLG